MPLKHDQEPKIDPDQLAETELGGYLRQYRIMEGDTFCYSPEPSGKLKMIRNTIMISQNEQKNILADLKVATSKRKKKIDVEISATICNLLRDYNCLGKSIETEKSQIAELDREIKRWGRKVDKLRYKTITVSQGEDDRIISAQRSVIKMENKLESYMTRVNKANTKNAQLRKEIEHLLIERAYFGVLWYRTIKSLIIGKKIMLDLVEQSTIAYNERDECVKKLKALKNLGRTELTKCTEVINKCEGVWNSNSKLTFLGFWEYALSCRFAEFRILKIKYDHSEQLHEFLGTKGQKRLLLDLEAKQMRKKEMENKKLEQTLSANEATLQEIIDHFGENNTKKITDQIVSNDEHNFTLFNYINELNYESEELSSVIENLKHNIDVQRKRNKNYVTQQQNSIENLAMVLTKDMEKAKVAKETFENFNTILDQMFKGIDQIFLLLQCDDDPILDLLMGAKLNQTSEVISAEISRFNVLLYLSIIEKRVTDLVQIVFNKEKIAAAVKEKRAKVAAQRIVKPDVPTRYVHNSLRALIPSQPCPLCVDQEVVSDVIDALQFAQDEQQVVDALAVRMKLPHALDRMHNVSACHLPGSRRIIQARYQ